jgi:hypothetical protein
VAGKQRRHKSEQRLNRDHGWRCKPGYQVVVLNRGDVRFDVPKTWVVSEVPDPGGAHFTMFDKPEPDDDIRFQVSVQRLNPQIDWSGVQLDTVLAGALGAQDDSEDRKTVSQTEPVLIKRPDLTIAWNETLFIDTRENREAYTRALLAHGSLVQAFMTLDYWLDDTRRALPAWDEILRSLRLGQYVKDPLQGPPVYH